MAASTIRANARGHYEASTINYWQARSMHDTGTALYQLVQDTGATPKARIMKADDRLAPTTWTEQDSANNKTIAAVTNPYDSFYNAADGYIYVVVFTAANTVSLYRFNTAGDTWQSAAIATSTANVSVKRGVRLVIRDSDDWYMLFSSQTDDADVGHWRSVAGTIATSTTSILSGGSTAASHILDAGIDSTGMIWTVIYDAINSDARYVTITTGNVISSAIIVDGTNPGAADTASAGGRFGLYDDAGTDKVLCGYTGLVSATPIVMTRILTLESPAATGNVGGTVSPMPFTTTADNGVRTPIHTARLGTTDYVVAWDDASSGSILYSTRTTVGGSWTRTVWKTGVGRPSDLLVVADGLGVVYHDSAGTTMLFDWLVAPTTTANADATMTADTLTVSGKAVTGTVAANASATMTADALTVSGKVLTATGQRNESATLTRDQLTVSGKTVTGTAVVSATGTMTADALTVSGKAVTGTATTVVNATGNMTADALSVSGKALTATGQRNETGTMTRDALSVSGKAVTATGQRHETGTMTRDQLTVTGRAVTATSGASATITRDTLSVSGKTLTGQSGASATLSADALSVSGKALTATAQRNETGTLSASALTVLGKGVTASADAGATGIMTADALTVSGKTLTATGQRHESATLTRDILSVTGQSLSATAQRNETATLARHALVVAGRSVLATDLVQTFGGAQRIRVSAPVFAGRATRSAPVLAARSIGTSPVAVDRSMYASPVAAGRGAQESPVGTGRIMGSQPVAVARTYDEPPIAVSRTKKEPE